MNRSLTVMIKPVSDTCQLSCKYCFYRDLSCFGAATGSRMTSDTADLLISDVAHSIASGGHVTFAFQGGEPLLAGVDFYRRFFSAADRAGLNASYVFQTNGIEISGSDSGSDWIGLFREKKCLIGLSIDGASYMHDANRVSASGVGTHGKVIESYRLLSENGIDVNILTVLSHEVMQHADALFDFYVGIGASHVQLISCLPKLGETGERVSGEFLVDFYKLWRRSTRNGVPPFEVREFGAILGALSGKIYDPCIFGGRCSPQLIVEADGSIYPCDFFVMPEYKTGQVGTGALDETLKSEGMMRFAGIPRALPNGCRSCRYAGICRGGCVRMRDAWKPDLPDCPIQKLLNYIVSTR